MRYHSVYFTRAQKKAEAINFSLHNNLRNRDERSRTSDLLLPKQAPWPLGYIPSHAEVYIVPDLAVNDWWPVGPSGPVVGNERIPYSWKNTRGRACVSVLIRLLRVPRSKER